MRKDLENTIILLIFDLSITNMMTQTEFYAKFGGGILNVQHDNAEFGDHLILHPEGIEQAKELEANGYTIVAVYEPEEDGKDNYVEIQKPFDNSTHPYKIGYFAVSGFLG